VSLDELHVIVQGHVQGVGFRDATQARAMALRLVGWVRNLSDGSVQVYARGSADAVATLRAWLASGPPLARVDAVQERPATSAQRAVCPAHHFVRLGNATAE
jgi:acylphosphatase